MTDNKDVEAVLDPKRLDGTHNDKKKKSKPGPKKKDSFKLDLKKYYEVLQQQDSRGYIRDVEVLLPQFEGKKGHIFRCKLRCAKAYDISIEHLEKAYYELNGKKIDGFYVNHIFDRYGFYDGLQISRKTLLENLKSTSTRHAVDVAEQKLRVILNNNDIKKAYGKYVADGLESVSRETTDKAVYGE